MDKSLSSTRTFRLPLRGVILAFALTAVVAVAAATTSRATPTEAATGGINIDAYCQMRTLGTARAQLLPPYNVYSWACRYIGGQAFGINLTDACRWQYGRSWAYARFSNYYNPYSWYCQF